VQRPGAGGLERGEGAIGSGQAHLEKRKLCCQEEPREGPRAGVEGSTEAGGQGHG
jgi:hypothetical protein